MAAAMGQRCVLCGSAPATTREHIPPESFFHTPYPADLITVRLARIAILARNGRCLCALIFLRARLPGRPPSLERQGSVRVKLNRQGYLGLLRRFREASVFTSTDEMKTGSIVTSLKTRPEGERILTVIRKRCAALPSTSRTKSSSKYAYTRGAYYGAATEDDEMWQAAAAEAMTGTVGQRGDVFGTPTSQLDEALAPLWSNLSSGRISVTPR